LYAGLLRLTFDKAGLAAMPRPRNPASLPKCRRESLSRIDVPRNLYFVRRRALQHFVGLEWIDLIDRNPVYLEFHHNRRLAVNNADAPEIFRAHREIDDHVHGIVEADRDFDVRDRLAVDEIDDAVALPQHAIVVKAVRSIRQQKVKSAGSDPTGRRNPPMCRHHEIAGALPASLQDIDLRRPAAVVGKQPECRPDTGPDGKLGTNFEVAIFLRERTLAR